MTESAFQTPDEFFPFQEEKPSLDSPEPMELCDEPTDLLSAMETIVCAMHRSNLKTEAFVDCDASLGFLMERAQMTSMQAVLFSLCIDQSYSVKISMSDLRRWIGCPMISLLRYRKELDELVERGLLMSCPRDGERNYAVPTYVLDGLKDNQLVTHSQDVNLSIEDFFDRMDDIFMQRQNSLSYDGMVARLQQLVKDNPQLSYCKHIQEYKELGGENLVLLHFLADQAVVHDNNYLVEHEINPIMERPFSIGSHFRALSRGDHKLLKMGLVNPANEDGMAVPHMFSLTNEARKTLLIEADLEPLDPPETIAPSELIEADKISAKPLYYNKEVDDQISRLQHLLEKEQFSNICQRLQEHGMRQGFACLFYGAPGTGKTETALQLARLTGRDVMQVNISEIRDKWVGESEKNVKSVFDRYRKAVENSDVAPILLFNEADALLTTRCETSSRSTDKMENAMQNIFLQEIENLQGILIATTNLTTILDKAFERRFLYKIQFTKPDAECRSLIWHSMIPSLSMEDAKDLATLYDFSGGQIENISRKHTVDAILYGPSDNPVGALKVHCAAEMIQKSGAPLGFLP